MKPIIPPSEIKKFRNYWKQKIENEVGIGTWCKIDPSKKAKTDPNKFIKLLEKAQKQKSTVKLIGKFAISQHFSIYESWLEAVEVPWNFLKITSTPPKNKSDSEKDSNLDNSQEINKPLTTPKITLPSNPMNITPDPEHDCPWLKLPQVEAKIQQQYRAELDRLKASELDLVNERNNFNQKLQQTQQEIQNICKYWGVSNLTWK